MAATKTQKQVQVIARYQLKKNGHVVYSVKSSNGQDTYTTTLVNGKAAGCDCASRKPCYHMTQLEQREQGRKDAARAAMVALYNPCDVA